MRTLFPFFLLLALVVSALGCDDDDSQSSAPEICDNQIADNNEEDIDCEDKACSHLLSCVPEHWSEGLEEGVNHGLAADYPRDVGIEAHPYVLAEV